MKVLAKINSGAVVGLDTVAVTVEVDVASGGLPSFTIVGLPDKAVEESRERVRAAIKNSGADFPARQVTVNLAPADLPKVGPAYDLPIALGLLIASGQLEGTFENVFIFGELSLDGKLRSTNGVLPLVMLAKKAGMQSVFLPDVNAQEASIIDKIKIYPISSLTVLLKHLKGLGKIYPAEYHPLEKLLDGQPEDLGFDFADIVGQEQAKRAMEIAAAGSHNVFLQGPPGAGKTMLSRAMAGILPAMTEDEALEVTKIYSVTGNLPIGDSIIKHRPFRSPHHTTSRIGLIGGGSIPTPGEISLAHRGVLFLDEFAEFPRNVHEALRQPIEDKMVSVARARRTTHFPANFVLVAASNPCPCGYLYDEVRHCICLPGQVIRYQKRLSGPIMDRIDLHIEVPTVQVEKLTAINNPRETSASIKKRVQKARERQLERFRGTPLKSNGDMGTRDVRTFCSLSSECLTLLGQAAARFGLSARGYFRIVKVAMTIADLEESNQISTNHVAEALQYRPRATAGE